MTQRSEFEAWATEQKLFTGTTADAWGAPIYLPYIQAMWTGWQAAQAAQPAQIPADHSLVPNVPTPAMLKAGSEWDNGQDNWPHETSGTAAIYTAMLGAIGSGNPSPAGPENSKLIAGDHIAGSREMVEKAAKDLIHAADRAGLRVTLERMPLKPLAMGHAAYLLQTWPIRSDV